MPEHVAAVAGGVVGALLLLLLIGISIYIFWRKRCIGSSYEELLNLSPRTRREDLRVDGLPDSLCHSLRIKTVPFVVPTLSRRDWAGTRSGVRVQEDSEPYTAPDVVPFSSCCHIGPSALGSINPALYTSPEDYEEADFPEGNIGRVWFAVEYESETERLVVSLTKVRNLQLSSDSCNPFVKMHLLPDERRYLQSKTKRKTLNPQFDETFVFQVSGKTLHQRTLRLSVYHVDKIKKHHLLGQVLFPLKNENLTNNEKLAVWRDLKQKHLEPPSECGYIQFSLGYNVDLQRLTVVVLRARDILFQEERGIVSSAFVKVSLMNHNKFIKSKKTAIIIGSPNPVYNETFSFKLEQKELDTASLSLSVLQDTEGESLTALCLDILFRPFIVFPFWTLQTYEEESS